MWENYSIRVHVFLSLSLWHLCVFYHSHTLLIISLPVLLFSGNTFSLFHSRSNIPTVWVSRFPLLSERPSVWSIALFLWSIFIHRPTGSPVTDWEAAHLSPCAQENLLVILKNYKQEIRNSWQSGSSWKTLVMQAVMCELRKANIEVSSFFFINLSFYFSQEKGKLL